MTDQAYYNSIAETERCYLCNRDLGKVFARVEVVGYTPSDPGSTGCHAGYKCVDVFLACQKCANNLLEAGRQEWQFSQ